MRTLFALLAAALVLPASAAAQTEGKPIVGGGSFNTAPLIVPGKYSDTVAAGETVYWKVKLAKGQVLKVRATVDTSQIETDSLKDDWLPGLYYLDYDLNIFSPLREELSKEGGGDYNAASARLEGSTGASAKTGTATAPRALGFEQLLASDYNKDTFPGPGEWYVSLSAADSGLVPAEIPLELPVDLDVQVLGAAQPSSPDFAKNLPAPSPAQRQPSAPGGAAALTNLAADQPADPALTIALVSVIALVGGLALGALAFVVVRARPRS